MRSQLRMIHGIHLTFFEPGTDDPVIDPCEPWIRLDVLAAHLDLAPWLVREYVESLAGTQLTAILAVRTHDGFCTYPAKPGTYAHEWLYLGQREALWLADYLERIQQEVA